MNLIALGLGLLLEKLLTRWLHLREPHWFDGYFDWTLKHIRPTGRVGAILGAGLVAIVPVLPVLLFAVLFHDVLGGYVQRPLYVAFATLVFLFSLGPRDLGDEVDEYVAASDAGDDEKAAAIAHEILEKPLPESHPERIRALREAIFVQANNRLFGVIFWFLVLGVVGASLAPVGAWLFRITDLMRKRAVHSLMLNKAGKARVQPKLARGILRLHGALAWPSARLLAIGYALAGSFEDAVSDWRAYYQNTAEHFFERSNDILATAGCGAQGVTPTGEDMSPDGICELEAAASEAALSLVTRTFIVWLTFIALATVFGVIL